MVVCKDSVLRVIMIVKSHPSSHLRLEVIEGRGRACNAAAVQKTWNGVGGLGGEPWTVYLSFKLVVSVQQTCSSPLQTRPGRSCLLTGAAAAAGLSVLQKTWQIGKCVVTLTAAHILPDVIPDINILSVVLLRVFSQKNVFVIEVIGVD